MKVLFITTGLLTGGAEMMLLKLVSRIDRDRFEPVVLSLLEGGPVGEQLRAAGVPVHVLGMRAGIPGPISMLKLRSIVRTVRPDVLQGWMYHGNLAASVAKRFAHSGTPVLWNIRHSLYDIREIKRLTALIVRASARLSSAVNTVIYCSHLSQVQHEALGYDPRRSLYIPNGFDTDEFAPNVQWREQFRREVGASDRDILIGAVGRSHPQKDHANFIRAARIIADRASNAKFVLTGRGLDSSNTVLTALVQELRLDGRVTFLGERKDVPRVLSGLDLLVSSSAFGEAFPNVLGEAMSSALPVIATDVGDSALIVGDAARIVPPRNTAALAEAVCNVLALSDAQRVAIGQQVRSRVIEHYSLTRIVQMYENLFEASVGVGSGATESGVIESEQVRKCAGSGE
ncbi:MAG: glycosyltransferase [Deltaproteobacteria bacterium]|nr:glycosyltransferase [Deltaproteobacteria bacterium]